MPTDEFLAAFYSRFHRTMSDGGGYELWEQRTTADFSAKIDRIKQLRPIESVRLLDVGCGKGFFVKACRDRGIDAQGIDLSDTAVTYATDSLGIPAICGRVEDHQKELGQFDVVTFWATIEHLSRPIEALISIRKVLRPGGLLFLDTGIADDVFEKILPSATQWYDPPQHLLVCSEAGLRAGLETAGLRVVYVDRCFERTWLRRVVRQVRGVAAALGLRLLFELFRLKTKQPFGFTRLPLGNLIFAACELPVTSQDKVAEGSVRTLG